MSRPLFATGLAALVLVAPAAGLAAPRLQVDVDACVGVPAEAVRRDVGIELDALVVEARDTAALDTTRVAITCDGELLRITVDDPLSGKVTSRRVDPRREPRKGRARLLALSAVELVAASWVEVNLTEAPPAAAVDATASPAARASAAQTLDRLSGVPPRWSFAAFGSTRGFSSRAATGLGGGLAVDRRVGRNLVLGSALTVEGGDRELSLGRAEALLASAAFTGKLRADLGRLGLEAGLGWRVGLARLEGRPPPGQPFVEAYTRTRPWAGPVLAAAVAGRLGAGWFLVTGVESGVVTLEIDGRVDDAPELTIDGFWLSAMFGLGWSR